MPHWRMKSVGGRICNELDNWPNKTVRTSRNSQGMDVSGLESLKGSPETERWKVGRWTDEVSSTEV